MIAPLYVETRNIRKETYMLAQYLNIQFISTAKSGIHVIKGKAVTVYEKRKAHLFTHR